MFIVKDRKMFICHEGMLQRNMCIYMKIYLKYLYVQGVSKKGNRTSTRYCIWITMRMNEIFSHSERSAFSYWVISFSCQMDKKWANTNMIKNVSQNHDHRWELGLKPLKMNPLWYLSLWISLHNYYIYIHNYY
jgi:hypothetical protein